MCDKSAGSADNNKKMLLNGTLATFFGCFGEFFRKETVIKETNSLQEFQDLLQSKKHCKTKNG